MSTKKKTSPAEDGDQSENDTEQDAAAIMAALQSKVDTLEQEIAALKTPSDEDEGGEEQKTDKDAKWIQAFLSAVYPEQKGVIEKLDSREKLQGFAIAAVAMKPKRQLPGTPTTAAGAAQHEKTDAETILEKIATGNRTQFHSSLQPKGADK